MILLYYIIYFLNAINNKKIRDFLNILLRLMLKKKLILLLKILKYWLFSFIKIKILLDINKLLFFRLVTCLKIYFILILFIAKLIFNYFPKWAYLFTFFIFIFLRKYFGIFENSYLLYHLKNRN